MAKPPTKSPVTRSLPTILIYLGLALAVLGFATYFSAPLIVPTAQTMNWFLYPVVIAALLGAAVGLAQLALLIAGKYRSRLKLFLPEFAVLSFYLYGTAPIVLGCGDMLLLTPHSAAAAAKQINSCVIMNMASQYGETNPQHPDLYLTYKSGRTAVTDGKLWPEIRDIALKDAGHCGYKGISATMKPPFNTVTLYNVIP